MGEVEFLFHHGRAFGYLAGLQIEGFAKRNGVAVTYAPSEGRLRQNTDHAIECLVFGAPTFFVGDEMFRGNDRFDFVEERQCASSCEPGYELASKHPNFTPDPGTS